MAPIVAVIRVDNLDRMDRLARLAWAVIGWNVLTILLGSVVRATHSGAGCGRTWPTCGGELVPALEGATAIEFTHRIASGLALVLVGVLAIMVLRSRAPGHPARRSVLWAGVAIIGEALIGAAIVLYEWVGRDDSVARVISVPLHLVNTLLLLAALTLTAWFLKGPPPPFGVLPPPPSPLRGTPPNAHSVRWREKRLTPFAGGRGRVRALLLVGALALVFIFATGAITALADTLFPAAGQVDVGARHFLTRLRILHPILAIAAVAAAGIAVRAHGSGTTPALRNLGILTLAQLGLGLLNILLKTPLWLQILHLAIADLIWISYVWLSAQTLASDSSSSFTDATGSRHENPLHK
jgi:heme A synthase